jgi:hypothetical protein
MYETSIYFIAPNLWRWEIPPQRHGRDQSEGHTTQPVSNGEMSDSQRSRGFLTNSNS